MKDFIKHIIIAIFALIVIVALFDIGGSAAANDGKVDDTKDVINDFEEDIADGNIIIDGVLPPGSVSGGGNPLGDVTGKIAVVFTQGVETFLGKVAQLLGDFLS